MKMPQFSRFRLLLIILFAFIALILFLIPIITEWYIEKNDIELIGREIEIEDVDMNLVFGTMELEQVTLFEPNALDTFFHVEELAVKMAWHKTIWNKLHIRRIAVWAPSIRIRQEMESFNFDDFIQLFDEDSLTQEDLDSESWSWEVNELKIYDGRLDYSDVINELNLSFEEVNVSSTGASSEDAVIPIDLGFRTIEGGTINSEVQIDLNDEFYKVNMNIDDVSLQPFSPYLSVVIALTEFKSLIGGELHVAGSYAQTDSIMFSGDLHLKDLLIKGLKNDSILSWKDLQVQIDTANIRTQKYDFGTIKLIRPYLQFVLTEEGDNFTYSSMDSQADSLFQMQSVSDESEFYNPFELMALYLYDITHTYLSSNFTADTIAVYQGWLDYEEKTLHDPFKMKLWNLSAVAINISPEDDYAFFDLKSKVNERGNLVGELDISRRGINDMVLNVEVDNLSISDTNPYVDFYMGHNFDDGNLILISKNRIDNYYLESENSVLIERIKVGDKSGNTSEYNVPLKLAIALLRDFDGNVDLELPIDGRLDDPNYRIGRVILQVIKNILVKAVAAPYKLLAEAVGANEEDMKAITFDPLQSELTPKQQRKLNSISKALEKKPELHASLVTTNQSDEAPYIAVSELKKAFWDENKITERDSTWLPKLKVTSEDTLFLNYVQSKITWGDSVNADNLSEIGLELVDTALVNSFSRKLWSERQKNILQYLELNSQVPLENWSFVDSDTLHSDTTSYPYFMVEYRVD
jgi:hypothetical protein